VLILRRSDKRHVAQLLETLRKLQLERDDFQKKFEKLNDQIDSELKIRFEKEMSRRKDSLIDSAHVEWIEKELKPLQSRVDAQKKQIDELTNTLSMTRNGMKRLTEEEREHEKEIIRMKGEIQAKANEIQELKQETKRLAGDLSRSEVMVKDLAALSEELLTKMQSLTDAFEPLSKMDWSANLPSGMIAAMVPKVQDHAPKSIFTALSTFLARLESLITSEVSRLSSLPRVDDAGRSIFGSTNYLAVISAPVEKWSPVDPLQMQNRLGKLKTWMSINERSLHTEFFEPFIRCIESCADPLAKQKLIDATERLRTETIRYGNIGKGLEGTFDIQNYVLEPGLVNSPQVTSDIEKEFSNIVENNSNSPFLSDLNRQVQELKSEDSGASATSWRILTIAVVHFLRHPRKLEILKILNRLGGT